ncbi:hypothetical protein FB562_0601 [Homoserinimonas aerilata]|uniref:Uncharacterized protein n=1 Tax=Homoserinimonas aerilata TaxID=1162970 RepID=A0A542YHH8_9MICO|nr:hypothetical protein [Homoserinimonas aerilata]TQL47537.1 hypothetical protein FB562_0601 [Homoserinimonas aerilata]
MGRFTDAVKGMFRRRKPVTPQEAEDLADWVNEGGAFDPAGPPEVSEHDGDEPKGTGA